MHCRFAEYCCTKVQDQRSLAHFSSILLALAIYHEAGVLVKRHLSTGLGSPDSEQKTLFNIYPFNSSPSVLGIGSLRNYSTSPSLLDSNYLHFQLRRSQHLLLHLCLLHSIICLHQNRLVIHFKSSNNLLSTTILLRHALSSDNSDTYRL